MYKCLQSDFDKLERKIRKIIKKLDSQGLEYNFEIFGEDVELVKVIDVSIPSQPVVVDELYVDVVLYNFTMDEIKLGNYKTIAILEHNRIEDSDENLVYQIDPAFVIDKKYRTISSKCDHCNTNRKRNTTVLLQDLDNPNSDLLQIGLTCLQDYTGISDIDVIRNYMSLQDIFLNEVYIDFKHYNSYPRYAETLSYLANSIEIIENEGYKKDVVKEKAWWKSLGKGLEDIDIPYVKKAETVLNFFADRDFTDNEFMQNIKLLLQNKYNKMSGFIAYAYLAYQKQLEYEITQKTANETKQISKYVGNVGDRIIIEVHLVSRFVFEGYYGHQQLYIFEDDEHNIYKWKTGKYLIDNQGKSIELNKNKIRLKGTIKGHEEYKGIKQTELTRCKML